MTEQSSISLDGGFDGRAIANYVLDYCEAKHRSVTNLALQKVLFFCHAEFLVRKKIPLIKHQFEAWQHGPVLQYLYSEFKIFEGKPITSRATSLDPTTGKRVTVIYAFDAETRQFLEEVADIYTKLDAWQLVKLSHAEGGPWDKAWNHGGITNPGMKIAAHDIIESFNSPSATTAIN